MRLDRALVARGLARSRGQAQELLAGGGVRLNGRLATKPATDVAPGDHVDAVPDPYVSRAAHKLRGALRDLDITPAGRALDAGASTGGFTQVLLAAGCREVIAVDVGTGQLAEQLRTDPRVVVWEQTNLRELSLRHVGGQPVDLVVADVSFISLALLVWPLAAVLSSDGLMLLLVKPQFEVGRAELSGSPVVTSPQLHRRAVDQVVDAAATAGWFAWQGCRSRLPGSTGNTEFFVAFRASPPPQPLDVNTVVAG